jgi:AAA+ superfamily predicted ATPase
MGGARRERDLSLRHLEAELARIDARIRRAVHCWQLAGQDPGDAFRGLYVSDAEAEMLLEQPLGTHWAQTVAPKSREARAFAKAEAQASHQAQSVAEAAHRQGQVVRLEHVATAFGLDRFDLDTFLICLAPALDLRYERIYGYLQDDVTHKRPRVNLVLDLLCEPGADRLLMLSRFADDAPLFRYHVLERVSAGPPSLPLLSQTLHVDDAIVAWLLGRYQPHADLGTHATLVWPEADEADQLLAAEGTQCVAPLEWPAVGPSTPLGVNADVPPVVERPIVVFYGPDQASQAAAARRLAAQARRPLLTVDLEAVTGTGCPPPRALQLALRDARLAGAVPCLAGWDACLAEDGTLSPDLLAQLCAHPDMAVVAGRATWQPGGIDRERPMFWIEFPVPAYAQRVALWQHFLQIGKSANQQISKSANRQIGKPEWAAAGDGIVELSVEQERAWDLAALAGQFALTTGQIRDAVASARDRAAQRGGPLQPEDLFAAARAHSSPRLSSLARKIEPRYTWADIVLPDDQLALLREIVATVRGRPLVLDEWGMGRKLVSSAGVTVLFAGPPGTGKTMAAEVVAAKLGLDLYKIDLSTVVSKYIGETEKNLERIFQEAENSNAILFFDEADAIFGKRSEVKDAHDRYANIEISYLLQRMEMYDGVTVLATNLRANLDEAFTRRLQFAVDFPFPEEDYRLRIWETLFPADVPCEPDLDFELLARRFKLAGGSIRNVIVSATYLAAADGQRVTMAHLLHGTRRELQKMGRLVNEADMRVGSKQ